MDEVKKLEEDYNDVYDAVELKNVKPSYISILHTDSRPSNRQAVMIKSEKGDVALEMEVTKADSIKGLIYATAMKALYKDTDGEYYTNETVEASAHWFAKNIGLDEAADTNHNFELEDNVIVVETFVDKSENGWEWKVVFDVSKNEKLMKLAKENKITGVSIAGVAEVVRKHQEDSLFNKLLKRLKEHFEPKEAIGNKEIVNKKEDEMDKEQVLEILKESLPVMLAEIEKAKSEQEEVKKAEADKIAKEQEKDEKLENLEKENKELSEKLEKALKDIEDLNKEVADSKQGVPSVEAPKKDDELESGLI